MVSSLPHVISQAERRTRQRDAIVDALSRAAGPLSPQQILADAQADIPTLGLATVYRALKSLIDSHLLSTVCLADGTSRYELRKDHHHHFHCGVCDRVFDIPADCGHEDTHAPRGFAVDGHEVVLFGQCPSCRTPAHSQRASR